MKHTSLFALATATLLQACSSDGTPGPKGADGKDGTPGTSTEPKPSDASLSLVTPNKGILDRDLDVSIGGDGTTFAEGAELSFGPGVEVLEVTASTPTLINAKIRVARDAEVGPRDVKIGDLTAKAAFSVVPAIQVVSSDGKAKVSQGGLVQFGIENNDTHAFDANAFRFEAGDLIDLGSAVSGPQNATAFFLAAPLAKPGSSQVAVMNLDSGGKERLSFLSASDALTVSARSATSLNLDTSADQTFSGDTKLFKLTSAANEAAIVDYRIEVDAAAATVPVAFVFGNGGGKDDRLGQVLPSRNPFTGEFSAPPYDLHVAVPVAANAKATNHYVVLADLAGKAGAKAKITASRSAASVVNETGSAHGMAAPQLVGAVSSSGQLVGANLATAGEVDAYKFTVPADAKLQLVVQSDADLEVILTKDAKVIEDDQDTPAPDKKVLGYAYPSKQFAAQRTLSSAVGTTEVYVIVQGDAQGSILTGAYTLGLRKVP